MKNTHTDPDTDIQAIGWVLKDLYSRNYDRHGRGGLTAAVRLLAENDRRVLLYGLRRLLDVRVDLSEVLSLDGPLDEVRG